MSSEKTFVGGIAPVAEGWRAGYDYGGEIVEIGANIFKSEELVDKIYALYLMLMGGPELAQPRLTISEKPTMAGFIYRASSVLFSPGRLIS